MTNVQCHMAHISILWYTECWTIQLKCISETKQEIISLSYPKNTSMAKQLLVCMSLRLIYFKYFNNSYNVWYVYNKWSIRTSTKEVAHHPTHKLWRLFPDLLLMGWWGCASAIDTSSCCNSKTLRYHFIHYHISSRWVFGITYFNLRNFAVVAIECSCDQVQWSYA